MQARYWTRFLELTEEADGRRSAEGRDASVAEMTGLWRSRGSLPWSPRQALDVADAAIARFYAELMRDGWRDGVFPSPVAGCADSSWMTRSDFCFFNIRAIGPERDRPGTFIDALKLLPVVRVNSIHLAPFFDCVFGNVYAVDSLTVINSEVVHPGYAAAGLGARDQLALFVDAAHALGMTVGFDLDPHTAQFSRVVLDNPEMFRWLELAPDRKGLAGGVDEDAMLAEEAQAAIACRVRSIVRAACAGAGLARLEDPEAESGLVRATAQGIVRELIAAGLWTIPSHTWGGAGLPGYIGYNDRDGYPLFEYLDAEGEDQSGHAFGMLTPIKTGTGLSVNTNPTAKAPSAPYEPGIRFFAGIFAEIRRLARFDFVRLDYVDHVFDSVLEGTRDRPLSDRPTPALLERIIAAARRDDPATGAMAERMGYDIESYAGVGFDLILGADVIRKPDMMFLDDMLRFNRELVALNAGRRVPVSIQFAIDSHDTGHPQIDMDPSREGLRGMLWRLFLARFGSCGAGRRPKYEVIGNQDLTSGLYEANNRPVSLEWRDDRECVAAYHAFEDLYRRLRPSLDVSCIREYRVTPPFAFWCLDRMDGFRLRFVCVAYPDGDEAEGPLDCVHIYPFDQYWFDVARVDEICLPEGKMRFVPIEVDGTIAVEKLVPGDVRLFMIRESGTKIPEVQG